MVKIIEFYYFSFHAYQEGLEYLLGLTQCSILNMQILFESL